MKIVLICCLLLVSFLTYPAIQDTSSNEKPVIRTDNPENYNGTSEKKKTEGEIKLRPIPPTQLEHLEEAVRNQIIQGTKDVETVAANPAASNQSRARAYGQLGQYYHCYKLTEAAEACYLNAVDLDPVNLEWSYSLAYLYQTTGKFSEALKVIANSESRWKGSEVEYLHYFRMGECYKAMSNIPEAKKAFAKAFQMNPQDPAILARLGETALVEKRYDEAIHYFDSALKKQPGANKLHYSLAMAYRGKGDMTKARQEISKSGMVGIQPPDTVKQRLKQLKGGYLAHYQAGKLAYQAGRFNDAIKEFLEAIKANPKKPGAYINLGVTYFKFQAYRDAIEQFEKALEIDSTSMTARYNLGEIYVFLNQPDQALPHLEAVVAKNPDDAGAHHSLARVYLKLKKLNKALHHFKTAIHLEPSLERSWVGISTVHITAERYAEAIDILETAHTRLPYSMAITRALANQLASSSLLSLRNGKRALELAMKVYNQEKDYQIVYIISLAYAELDRCDEAEKWLENAIDMASKSPQTRAYINILKSHLYYIKTHSPCRVPGKESPPSTKSRKK